MSSRSRSSRSPKDPEREYARAQQAAKEKQAKSAALAQQLQHETEPSSASRMRPILDVCNRIKHDAQCQQDDLMDWFSVVYLDRLKGEQTVKFSVFFTHVDCEDVPLHRVLRVKLYDFLLWDRERKIDRVFGSSAGHKDEAGKKMNLEQVLSKLEKIRAKYEARVAAEEEAERRARLLEERKLNRIHQNIQQQRRALNQNSQQEAELSDGEEDEEEEHDLNSEESTSSDSMSSLYETDEEKVMALAAEAVAESASAVKNAASPSIISPTLPVAAAATLAATTSLSTVTTTESFASTSSEASVVVTTSTITPVQSSSSSSSPYSTIVPLLSSSECRPNYFICLRLTSPSLLSSLASFQSDLISYQSNYGPCCVPIATAHITLALMQLSDDQEVETARKVFQSMEIEVKKLCRIPNDGDHESSSSSSSSSSFSPLSVSISGVSTFASRVLYASIVPSLSTSLLQSVVALFQYRLVSAGIRVVRATDKDDVNLFVPHVTVAKTSTKENKRQNRRKNKMMKAMEGMSENESTKEKEDPRPLTIGRVNSFDSSSYSKYLTQDFGVQLVDAFHLCAMAGPKQSDGFYPVEASIRTL